MTARRVRLTPAEWNALRAAEVMAELEWTDNRIDRADTLRAAALVRAMDKVRDALTTPAVRR